MRACEAVLDGRREISRFFYETPVPVSDLMMLAVRGAGGPSHRDGGWDDLAVVLPAADRGFDAIVCESIDRIGRNTMRVLDRENLVAKYGATILRADAPWTEFSQVTARRSDRMWRQFTAALGDHDYATVNAVLATRRVRRGGG